MRRRSPQASEADACDASKNRRGPHGRNIEKPAVSDLLTAGLVQVTGVEPARSCPHMDLNHTRLPIPPYLHIMLRKFYTAEASEAGN